MDNTEESRKLIQEYRNKLKESEQSLSETEWDRYISETGTLLDDLYSDYEETLNARLDNIDILVADMIEQANLNSQDIQATIKSVANDVNYTLSDNLENIFTNKNTLLSTFVGDFTDSSTAIYQTIADIKTMISKMIRNSNTNVNTESYINSSDWSTLTEGWNKRSNGGWSYVDNSGEIATGWKKLDWQGKSDWYNFDNEGIMKTDTWIGDYFVDASGKMKTNSWIGHNGKYYWVGSDGKWLDLPGWSLDGKPNDGLPIYEYAKGSRYINKDQLAWTQEKGTEIIYRASDGALLTPLNQGDMVFTNEMSKQLFDIANGNLPDFMSGFKAPTIVAKTNATSVNNQNAISINLPSVTNYDEFKNALQKDNKFIGFMQEVTLGEILGKNKLNKNKY